MAECYIQNWCCPSSSPVKMQGKIFDIREMSVKWAEDMLCKHMPLRENCIIKRWRTPYTMGDLDLCPQFSDLLIQTSDFEITGFNSPKHPEYVPLSKSHFTNSTETEQIYNFCVNRSSKSRAVLNIQQGMSIGDNTKVDFPLPTEILDQTIEFGNNIVINRVEGMKVEKDTHWGGQHQIRVPPGSNMAAEVQLMERYLDIQFSAKMVVSGRIKILVTDPKNNHKVVRELDSDIASIVKHNLQRTLSCGEDDLGFTSIKTQPLAWFPDGCHWDTSLGTATFAVKGTGFFQFGCEQCVKIYTI